jgi:hypothetical protein
VSLGIGRIELKSFLEEGNSFGEVLGRQEFVARPTLEISVVGGGVVGDRKSVV